MQYCQSKHQLLAFINPYIVYKRKKTIKNWRSVKLLIPDEYASPTDALLIIELIFAVRS